MLSPVVTTVISFILVVVRNRDYAITLRSLFIFHIRSPHIIQRKEKNTIVSWLMLPYLLLSLFPFYVYMWMIYTGSSDIMWIMNSLVYLGDKEIIHRMMSIMIFVYVFHTLVIVPYLAVTCIYWFLCVALILW